MITSPIREIYNSPNGDCWVLCRDVSGNLSQDGHGPEHQALREVLANLDMSDGAEINEAKDELSVEVANKLSRALGQAVARCWSRLSQDVQHELFEAAVMSEGETIRQQLAVYLHRKHSRTTNSMQERAMPEPDSLGD